MNNRKRDIDMRLKAQLAGSLIALAMLIIGGMILYDRNKGANNDSESKDSVTTTKLMVRDCVQKAYTR